MSNDLTSYCSFLYSDRPSCTRCLAVFSDARTALGPLRLFSLPSLWPCFSNICLDCSCASLKSQLRGHLFSKALAVFFKTAKLLPSPHPYTLFPSSPYFPLSFFSLTPSGFLVYSLSSVFSYCSHTPIMKTLWVEVYVNFMSIYFVHVCVQEDMPFSLLFSVWLPHWNIEAFPLHLIKKAWCQVVIAAFHKCYILWNDHKRNARAILTGKLSVLCLPFSWTLEMQEFVPL